MAAAVDKKIDRVFKEDRRSKANAQGKTIALCAHGKQKAAKCHEGECNRDTSAATKKSQTEKKTRQDQGTDNGTNNRKRRQDQGTDVGTNNQKRRQDQGTDNGTNNTKARAEEKKFQAIKANRKAAHIDISDSEIADTMGDYFASGEPKKGAGHKERSTSRRIPDVRIHEDRAEEIQLLDRRDREGPLRPLCVANK